jgi:hypothetical protein
MKNTKNSRYILQLIVHCQRTRYQHGNSGYALLVTSILAILTFSMLSVFLFSTNLYKSVANTVLDSGTTFYAAETAMNKRAYTVRQKFVGYERPTGTSPGVSTNTVAEQMAICIAGTSNLGTGDMGCVNQSTDYRAAVVEYDGQGRLVERTKGKKDSSGNFINSNDTNNVQYRTYSFVRDITNYNPDGTVDLNRIKEGDYTGLNAQEYKYRVYTTAAKETNLGAGINKDVASQTMLQMDFSSRLIPLFQFAAFYENDLEITSSSNMSLNGPVHTNNNLRLVPGGTLTFNGKVTSAKKIYKALEFQADHGSSTKLITVVGGSSFSSQPGFDFGSIGNEAATRITPQEIADNNNILKENQAVLKVPEASFLDRTGEYHQKGDMVVYFDPNNADNTKQIEKVVASGVNFTDSMLRSLQQPVLAIPREHVGDGRLAESTRLCPNKDLINPGKWSLTSPPWTTENQWNEGNFDKWNEPTSYFSDIRPASDQGLNDAERSSLNAAQKLSIRKALQFAMLKTDQIVPFSDIRNKANSNFKNHFKDALNADTTLGTLPTGVTVDKLADTNLNVLADVADGCYLPASMQVLKDSEADLAKNRYVDRRENRAMKILQSNIKSLTVWNRDGQYLDASNVLQSTDGKLFTRSAEATTLPTGIPGTIAASACDYTCMGLGSTDTSNGGLVWHFSIDKTKAGYNYTSGNGTARAGDSTYGFAFSGGNRLPGALTMVSNQAIYVQGDFNNPSRVLGDESASLDQSQFVANQPGQEKKPVSFLADTITVLSNRCLDIDSKLNCFKLPGWINEIVNGNNYWSNLPRARTTVVRAAFLARTDVSASDGSENSGGLNNYMRMMENWSVPVPGGERQTFKYRGSFISLGRPREFHGHYRGGTWTGNSGASLSDTTGFFYNIPKRDFGFETDFNSQAGLPPLTPRVVYLKQKVFKRDYDRTDRSGTK